MKLGRLGYVAFIAGAAALALGTTAPALAKAKKAVAAAEPPPFIFCYQPIKEVCGEKGGQKFTYANTCFARRDGAKVVSDKACPAPKAKSAKAGKKSKKS